MGKYKHRTKFMNSLLTMGVLLFFSYLALSSIIKDFKSWDFENVMLLSFVFIFMSFFIFLFLMLVKRLLDGNQYYVFKNDFLEFPQYFFFIKPRIIKYDDIINSELMTFQRGFRAERKLRLTLKGHTMFISERFLAEDNIEDLQKEIADKIKAV